MSGLEDQSWKEFMQVGVVIVNYKTASLTLECLSSIALDCQTGRYKVIVVDNDSQDGSYEKITSVISKKGWKEWVRCIKSDKNGGFSYGNNVAIKVLLSSSDKPDFFFLLNPDTIAKPGAINNLVLFLTEHSNVGIVGSHIEDSNGTALHSSFKFHSWLTELNRGFSLGVLTRLLKSWVSSDRMPDHAEKTDWVSGASMMIRRAVFEKIGLLDESYFMYYEETDFCLNAMRSGWECWYVPNSKVVHFVGQSSGVDSAKMTKKMPQYWFNSRRRYFLKNHGVIDAVLADFCWLVGFSSWKLRNMIQRKPDNNPPNLLRDTFLNTVFVKGITVAPTMNAAEKMNK